MWYTILWKEILTKEPVSISCDLVGIAIYCASFIPYEFIRNSMRYSKHFHFELFNQFQFVRHLCGNRIYFLPLRFGFYSFWATRWFFFDCFLFAEDDILSVLKWLPSNKKWCFCSRICFFPRLDLVPFSSQFFRRFFSLRFLFKVFFSIEFSAAQSIGSNFSIKLQSWLALINQIISTHRLVSAHNQTHFLGRLIDFLFDTSSFANWMFCV